MARTGRPKKQIDQAQFEKLCGIFCSRDDICDFFEVSKDTLIRWCKETYNATFETVYKKYSSKGRCSLRRFQFNIAEKNAAMAIFLGKNYLGQTDKDPLDLKLIGTRIAALEAGQCDVIDDKTRAEVEKLFNNCAPVEQIIEETDDEKADGEAENR